VQLTYDENMAGSADAVIDEAVSQIKKNDDKPHCDT